MTTFVAASNAAGQSAGSAAASTVSVTPTLPSGTASGNRVFIIQCGTTTSGTTPTSWTVLGTKDATVGTGTAASGSGARRMTVYYRDYDGVWTMPALTLTSTANNSHWVGAVSIAKTSSGYTWGTPTISSIGTDFGTLNAAHSATTGSMTTHANGFVIVGSVNNDNVTSTGGALTQSGATFGTVTERCDGGIATGFIVAGKIHTASVTTGATAALTFASTLSASSEGGSVVIEQTEAPPLPKAETFTDDFTTQDTAKWFFLGAATATGGQLQVPVNSSYADSVSSTAQYDLTGSAVYCQAVQTPNLGNGGTEMYLQVEFSSGNNEILQYSGGNLNMRENVSGTPSNTSLTFDPVAHKWWRIRESAGTIFWDTSPDGATWTNRRSKAAGITVTSVSVFLGAGYFGTEPSPGTVLFDNFNITPAASNTGAFFAMF